MHPIVTAAPFAPAVAWIGLGNGEMTPVRRTDIYDGRNVGTTVSPSTVSTGGTVTYSLTGFPAQAEVQVSLNGGDGTILGTVTVAEDGTMTGRVVLPADVPLGQHSLNFTVQDAARPEAGPIHLSSPLFTVADVSVITADTAPPPAHIDPEQAASPAGVASVSAQAPHQVVSEGQDSFPLVGVCLLLFTIVLAIVMGAVVSSQRSVARRWQD